MFHFSPFSLKVGQKLPSNYGTDATAISVIITFIPKWAAGGPWCTEDGQGGKVHIIMFNFRSSVLMNRNNFSRRSSKEGAAASRAASQQRIKARNLTVRSGPGSSMTAMEEQVSLQNKRKQLSVWHYVFISAANFLPGEVLRMFCIALSVHFFSFCLNSCFSDGPAAAA